MADIDKKKLLKVLKGTFNTNEQEAKTIATAKCMGYSSNVDDLKNLVRCECENDFIGTLIEMIESNRFDKKQEDVEIIAELEKGHQLETYVHSQITIGLKQTKTTKGYVKLADKPCRIKIVCEEIE